MVIDTGQSSSLVAVHMAVESLYTQPALFALGTALHHLLTSLGITPDYLLGHSIGEITAAHLAGVLSLADAAVLAAARGRLMQACPPGGIMIALQATEEEVLPLLEGHQHTIAIAAVNSPTSVVISGDPGRAQQIAAHFSGQGRRTHHLRVSHAFHSPHMDPALDEFHTIASHLVFTPPAIPVLSTLTGHIATPHQLTSPDYWTQHIRRTVRFQERVETLLGQGPHTFLELSTHPILTPAITDTLDHHHTTSGSGSGGRSLRGCCTTWPERRSHGPPTGPAPSHSACKSSTLDDATDWFGEKC